jgi:uncharacterized protein YbjQ (UPF0145 family)
MTAGEKEYQQRQWDDSFHMANRIATRNSKNELHCKKKKRIFSWEGSQGKGMFPRLPEEAGSSFFPEKKCNISNGGITNDKNKHMILTTTNTIEGRPVQQYLGVISSETIIGANIFKDIFAGLRDIVGGRSGTYERVIQEAKDSAMAELSQKAQQLGANAIIGIDLDFETVGAKGSMLMVVATGTAVQV